MSGITYNQTINKLILLFGTITDRRQITMAEKYANRLVTRVNVYAKRESDRYFKKWDIEDELRKLIASNVERLSTEFEKV